MFIKVTEDQKPYDFFPIRYTFRRIMNCAFRELYMDFALGQKPNKTACISG